jgi:hypothetical protein
MLFVATIRDKTGDTRKFSFEVSQLEDGLDFLSSLASGGDTLLNVYGVDKDSLMRWPVSLFDGDAFSPRIQPLQAEWQAILARPLPDSTVDKNWYQARLAACEAQIVQQELLVSSLRQLLEQVPQLRATEGHKQALSQRYQAALATYEAQRTRIVQHRNRLKARISQLDKRSRSR